MSSGCTTTAEPFLRVFILLAALLVVAGCVATESGDCTMQEVAEIPVVNDHGIPIIDAAINGTAVRFAVDSGANTSGIGPRAAARLHLHPIGPTLVARSVSGAFLTRLVAVSRLTLGSAEAFRVTLAILGPFGMQRSLTPGDGPEIVGLFASDFLSNYDVEFDLEHHRIGLYTEHGRCGADFDPWDGPVSSVAFRLDRGRHIVLPALLDGAETSLMLDSGAGSSLINSKGAAASGVTAAALDADPKSFGIGVNGRTFPEHRHRFGRLEVGDVVTAPFEAAVGDTYVQLLGAPWLRAHRVWVSYPHNEILVAQ